ncbi:MAG: GLUG motif-containing protein, partial [bacterium]|nr:GLUG motif-containing protein [bacterium]
YVGNERSISNLSINRPDAYRVGFFGFTANTAQIRDLDILDISITASEYIGALAGKNDGAAISNCSSTGSISGTNWYVGGLTGLNNGSIENCSSACSVSGATYIGGLVGKNDNVISNSHSSGNVSGSRNGIGGFCGVSSGSINMCHSSGNVTYTGSEEGTGNSIGGFTGGNNGSIAASYCSGTVNGIDVVGGFTGSITGSMSNCYSLGNVTKLSVNENELSFGSFCGRNIGGSIQYCYSTGSVTYPGSVNPGDKGFVGTISETGTPAHTANFFDTETSGQSSGTGAAAKSTAAMKSAWTFRNYGWDFADESTNGTEEIWTIASGDNGGYPALAWQGCSNEGLAIPVLPEVTTTAVSNITKTSASSGGNVLFENGATVSARGVCWDINPNPDINDNKTTDGSGTGAFSSSLTDLETGATYYLRAYAQNSAGMGYGDEVSFTVFYFNGSGISEDPFLIGSLDDLRYLSEHSIYWDQGYYFSQTADIDAAACSTWNDGAGFSPIGDYETPFTGTFDGGGYTVSHLYMLRPEEWDVALFRFIENASISDVHLTDAQINNDPSLDGSWLEASAILVSYPVSSLIENCSVQGTLRGYAYCGLLVAYLEGGRIENCSGSGSVNGEDYIGGLVGHNEQGEIVNCFSNAAVSGDMFTGGLVGQMYDASISNSYCTGTVNATEESGGLIGRVSGELNSVAYCYCSVAVTSVTNSGAFIGHLEPGDAVNVQSCFWDVDSDGIEGNASGADSYGGTGKSTAEMTNATPVNNIYLLAGWDFAGETANGTDDIWNIGSGYNDAYPFFSWQYPEADVPLPVRLTSFDAALNMGSVIVTWVTESESENAAFLLYRDGELLAELEGAGTTTEPQSYAWTDLDVIPGKTYSYVLADVDLQGKETKHPESKVEVKVELDGKDFNIGAAYPNPFNPVT